MLLGGQTCSNTRPSSSTLSEFIVNVWPSAVSGKKGTKERGRPAGLSTARKHTGRRSYVVASGLRNLQEPAGARHVPPADPIPSQSISVDGSSAARELAR